MPSIRIAEFDTWRPGYGLASVLVLQAGTSVPADIFFDEELTDPAVNPQTLIERMDAGISYGRFARSIYTGTPYQLDINTVDRTGIVRPPLSTLADQDASYARAAASGGSTLAVLRDRFARHIDVRDYGNFVAAGQQGASVATNTATLLLAIGAAAARGGSTVDLPAGTYQISSVTLPEGVVLRGPDRGAATLQSTFAGAVVIVSGNRAGLSRLTLDGLSQVANSIGVSADNQNEITLDNVTIKRFETGINRNGGVACLWREVTISTCVNGYRARGDVNEDNMRPLRFNRWSGGAVEFCTSVAIDLRNDGAPCHDNIFENVFFLNNTQDCVRIIGAESSSFRDCRFDGNTTNLRVYDGTPLGNNNAVVDLVVCGGVISGGAISLSGTLKSVMLRRLDLINVTVEIVSPKNPVLVEDCHENEVTILGDSTSWIRRLAGSRGTTFGITTGNAATKAWAITLQPGEQVYIEAMVMGRRRNGVGHGFYHISVSARRPGATLSYDSQTGNFTIGNILTGAQSGATARIVADSDAGTTGTLTLQDISGSFVDDEIITDGASGSATVNGSISTSSAQLVGAVTSLRAAQETTAAYDATFVANGPQIELRVTGETGHTIEWTSHVEVIF